MRIEFWAWKETGREQRCIHRRVSPYRL
jgi:hypothetical protein